MTVLLEIENLVDNKPPDELSINREEFNRVQLENEDLKETIRQLEKLNMSQQNEIESLKDRLKVIQISTFLNKILKNGFRQCFPPLVAELQPI